MRVVYGGISLSGATGSQKSDFYFLFVKLKLDLDFLDTVAPLLLLLSKKGHILYWIFNSTKCNQKTISKQTFLKGLTVAKCFSTWTKKDKIKAKNEEVVKKQRRTRIALKGTNNKNLYSVACRSSTPIVYFQITIHKNQQQKVKEYVNICRLNMHMQTRYLLYFVSKSDQWAVRCRTQAWFYCWFRKCCLNKRTEIGNDQE